MASAEILDWASIPQLVKSAKFTNPVTLFLGPTTKREKTVVRNTFDMVKELKKERDRLDLEIKQLERTLAAKVTVTGEKTVTDYEGWTYGVKDGYERRSLDTKWARTKLLEKGVGVREIERHEKVTDIVATFVVSKPRTKKEDSDGNEE